MSEPNPRYILASSAIQAAFVNDVLCVQLSGDFTCARLKACLRRLRTATEGSDYGALVLNTMGARLGLSAQELAHLWGDEACPLAARPCAVVYDSSLEGARTSAFYEALGRMLAAGQPARLMGAFSGWLLPDALHWAAHRAVGYRLEMDRRGR